MAANGEVGETAPPPRRDAVAVMAALDAVGLTLTTVAAVVLAVNGASHPGWWAALAIAILAGAVTTVLLVWLLARRRMFVANVNAVASRLESGGQAVDLKFARTLRKQASNNADLDLAGRLEAATESHATPVVQSGGIAAFSQPLLIRRSVKPSDEQEGWYAIALFSNGRDVTRYLVTKGAEQEWVDVTELELSPGY